MACLHRLRPPEEEFDASFITVGEMVEVRRPNEKKTRKWHLARVLDLDLDDQHAVCTCVYVYIYIYIYIYIYMYLQFIVCECLCVCVWSCVYPTTARVNEFPVSASILCIKQNTHNTHTFNVILTHKSISAGPSTLLYVCLHNRTHPHTPTHIRTYT
jgi:hypothetical protein